MLNYGCKKEHSINCCNNCIITSKLVDLTDHVRLTTDKQQTGPSKYFPMVGTIS